MVYNPKHSHLLTKTFMNKNIQNHSGTLKKVVNVWNKTLQYMQYGCKISLFNFYATKIQAFKLANYQGFMLFKISANYSLCIFSLIVN